MDDKYYIAKMKNVIQIPIDGKDLTDKIEIAAMDKLVEAKVKAIIDKLKIAHEKFIDEDFGPSQADEFGAISLYGSLSSSSSGAKYPAPDSLKWERPQYDDDKFANTEAGDASDEGDNDDEKEEEENDDYGFGGMNDENQLICEHGRLFLDGSSSGDVIQGQLGDCWFLGALAVMGSQEQLLNACFWRGDSFKEYGLYVVRFFKDCNIIFVIIDDRLPAKIKDSRLIFASCKDPNELWVPYMEKAYAKLFGCYKALIGGYSHYALGDMTGFCPRLVVMKAGFTGYNEQYSDEQVWNLLKRYKAWNCLLGCSIQSNPKDNQKVEAEAGLGLYYGHAYSLLDMNEIDLKAEDKAKGMDHRLVKLRNPWGRGEWEGPFSDQSTEREVYDQEISKNFRHQDSHEDIVIEEDGTFFMPFREWYTRFTSLFAAINFPSTWKGQRCKGSWSGDVGGNRQMGTWLSNPKIKIRLNSKSKNGNQLYKPGDLREVFIGIYIRDSRMTMGFDYYKDPLYATPLAFDVVTEKELKVADPELRKVVHDASYPPYRQVALSSTNEEVVKQPPYNFGTTQMELMLRVDEDYYIIPSLYKRNQPGTYYISVYADIDDFFLEGGISMSAEHEPMQVGASSKNAMTVLVNKATHKDAIISAPKELKMSIGQFYEKKELLRERLSSECKRLHLNTQTIGSIFTGQESLIISTFKRRMLDLGFNLADFPDDDLIVLDEDNSGTISRVELLSFLKTGISFIEGSDMPEPPQPPIDDLLFKAADMEGMLGVNIISGRRLREATTWLNSSSSVNSNNKVPTRSMIRYDPIAAMKKIQDTALISSVPVKSGLFIIAEEIQATSKPKTSYDNKDSIQANIIRSNTNNMNIDHMKINTDAGIRLHCDAMLQQAENARTNNLTSLRRNKQNMISSSSNASSYDDKEGMLRLRTKQGGLKEKRDIHKDRETMLWLGYDGLVSSSIDMRKPISSSLPSSSLSSSVEKLKVYHQGDGIMPDIWDYLISTVITISSSRTRSSQAITVMNNRSCLSRQLLSSSSSSTMKGNNISTPKNLRHTPGTASVKSTHHISSSSAIQRATLQDSKDKLITIEEDQHDRYDEVYRRLILVPSYTSSEYQGNRHHTSNNNTITGENSFIRSLFKTFDSNNNGLISYDEFQYAMKSMNIDMTSDECRTLFNRLDRQHIDDNIDLDEFSAFFHDISCMKTLSLHDATKSYQSVDTILDDMYHRLHPLYIESSDVAGMITKTLKSDIIINNLNISSSNINIDKLKSLGVSITIDEMIRISRVFDENIMLFHDFMSHESVDINTALHWLDATLLRCLIERSGSGTTFSASTTSKLWTAIAGSEIMISYDMITKYYSDIIEDSIHHQQHHDDDHVSKANHKHNQDFIIRGQSLKSINGSIVMSPREVPTPSKPLQKHDHNHPNISSSLSSQHQYCSIMGIKVNILCRILVDGIIISPWNRTSLTIDNKTSSIPMLSYSGFEAYVRHSHINSLERKLHYMMHMNMNSNAGATYLLIHIYFHHNRDEVLIIAYDPILGEVYQTQWKEDVSHFITCDKLYQLLQPRLKPIEEIVKRFGTVCSRIYNNKAWMLYNPIDTSYEDQAISEMVNRIRLIKSSSSASSTSSSIIIAEDPKFIQELKKHLDMISNDVPFFSILTDVNLSFEVDKNIISTSSTIEKVVFASIRKHKHILKYLTSVDSSINIILSTYNADKRLMMSWKDMVNYLLDYCNPFVTIQLLPKYIEPEEYFYHHIMISDAYTGNDDDTKTLSSGSIHRGEVDIDGGQYPTWRSKFLLSYKPPKLASCKILSTETAKLKIDNKIKYVLIMIRQATQKQNKSFLFLTIYDPRSSTEYQCGVDKKSSLYHTISNASKNMMIDRKEDSKLSDLLLQIGSELEQAITQDHIIVGPAITPHLLIQVYNQRGREEELIGSSQVSISSALSSSGLIKPQWITLSYTTDAGVDDSSKAIIQHAGEILLDVSFRKLVEIEAERKASLDRLDRLSIKAKEHVRRMSKSGIIPSLGPADQAMISAPKSSKAKDMMIIDDEKKKEAQLKMLQETQAEVEKLRKENQQLKMNSSKSATIIENPDPATSTTSTVTATQDNQKKTQQFEESMKRLESERVILEQDKMKLAMELATKQAMIEAQEKEKKDADMIRLENVKLLQRIKELTAMSATIGSKDMPVTIAETVTDAGGKKIRSDALSSSSSIDKVNVNDKENASDTVSLTETSSSNIMTKEPVSRKKTPDSLPPAASTAASISAASISSADKFNDEIADTIQTLINRHDKRVVAGTAVGTGPLDAFERLLQSHSIENLVNAKQIVNAFADAAIDMTLDSAEMLLQRVGKPLSSTRDHITYQSLITFLKRRIASSVEVSSPMMQSSSGNQRSGSSSRPSSAIRPSSTPDNIASVSTKVATKSKQPSPHATSIASSQPNLPSSNEAISSNKPVGSYKAAVVGRAKDGNLASATSNISSSNNKMHGKDDVNSRLSETAPASSFAVRDKLVVDDNSSHTINHSQSGNPDVEVNWNEVPLPSKAWERKVDTRNGKVYYVNHETKSTQWHHPLKKSSKQPHTSKRPESATVRIPTGPSSSMARQISTHVMRSSTVDVDDPADDVNYDESESKGHTGIRQAWS